MMCEKCHSVAPEDKEGYCINCGWNETLSTHRIVTVPPSQFLWVVTETKGCAPYIYKTFLSIEQAQDTFGGKYSFRRLTIGDIEKGFIL